MTLLSRVANHVYWAGRYLERAEATARIVREHTNLLVDLPTSVPLTWEPLLLITGSREQFDAVHPVADERSIIRFLVADAENPGSVLRSVQTARDDLRSTREVLPRELWEVVNDLYLYVASNHADGVARATRGRFLDRVIGDVLRTSGIIQSTMRRDEVHAFLQAGRLLERADMATRVIDVRAGSILDLQTHHDETFEGVQWMSVLRSVSALQAYQRTTHHGVEATATLAFLLTDAAFPRSVAHCVREAGRAVDELPRADGVRAATEAALEAVRQLDASTLRGTALHEAMDGLQLAIGAVHDAVARTYFLAVPVPD